MANVPSGQVSCFLPTRTARLLKGRHHHNFARKNSKTWCVLLYHNRRCVTFILFLIMIGHSQSPPRSAQRGRLLIYWWEVDQRNEWKKDEAHHSSLLILISKTGQHCSEDSRGVRKHCRASKVYKFPEMFMSPTKSDINLSIHCGMKGTWSM